MGDDLNNGLMKKGEYILENSIMDKYLGDEKNINFSCKKDAMKILQLQYRKE